MKNKRLYTVSSIMLVCFLLLASCSEPFNPIEMYYGRISVSITGEETTQKEARTILPSITFDKYVYIFSKAGKETGTEVKPDNDGFFLLEIGSYTVTVMAYNKDVLVANGVSSQFSVSSGSNSPVAVNLTSINSTAKGQLNYTITYPTGSVAEVKLYKWPLQEIISLNPINLAEGNGINEILELVYGSYILTVIINKDGLYTGVSEAVQINSSTLTVFNKIFFDEDFHLTQYTISFDINGATSGTAPNAQIISDGSSIMLPDGSGFFKIGHFFGGWNTAADGKGTNYNAGASYIVNDNVTLYIKWISFNITVSNTNEWNEALNLISISGNDRDWFITIIGNIPITGTTTNSFGTVTNIHVTIQGNGKLYLTSQGSLLSIDSNQTLYIDSIDLTLQGLRSNQNGSIQDNNRAVISGSGILELRNGVISGNNVIHNSTNRIAAGVHINKFIMSGGEIRDNNGSYGGGVSVMGSNFSFTMTGGKINENTGGGVYYDAGNIIMEGGEISENIGAGIIVSQSINNTSFTMKGGKINYNIGNGVTIYNQGRFIMEGGEINGNYVVKSDDISHGVYVGRGGSFIMKGGVISNHNTSSSSEGGGGIFVLGSFNMVGGEIKDNLASSGGGVRVNGGNFVMEGGKIFNNNVSNTGAGGGVYISDTWDYVNGGYIGGNFTMTGGVISGNNGGAFGGGVCIGGLGETSSFVKAGGGIIYGRNEGINSNTAVLSGNAVHWSRSFANGGILSNDTTLWENDNFIASAPVPIVTSVVVTPSNISVVVGQTQQTQQFSAIVYGTYNPSQTVTWSVTGGGSGTVISSSGLLTIANNENATSLTIRATSTVNTSINGTATANITHTDIIVPGTSFASKLSWLQTNAISGRSYIVDVNYDEVLYSSTSLSTNNTIITIRGIGAVRTITMISGTIFTVNSGVTLILDNNIILQGSNTNSYSLVRVNSSGKLTMNTGATITGNAGGGVRVLGTFTMNGGTISNNKDNGSYQGTGVLIDGWGLFTMNGGIITDNSASSGGGVYIGSNGTFNMTGGSITRNTADWGWKDAGDGGGVFGYGTFNMSGGFITNNTAKTFGGGVHVSSFTISAGTISNNTAGYAGGGVAVGTYFNQIGGNINSNSAPMGTNIFY